MMSIFFLLYFLQDSPHGIRGTGEMNLMSSVYEWIADINSNGVIETAVILSVLYAKRVLVSDVTTKSEE